MSKIIRYTRDADTIVIGERHRDTDIEQHAEHRLGALFPAVSVLTAPDGERLIPIAEVLKIEEVYQRQLADARKSGHDEGYKKGHHEGLEQGREESRKVLGNFNQAIKDAIGQREAMLNEARQQILDLVVKVSRKVTFDAIEVDREKTAALIAGVIDQLVDRSHLKIKVHPDHLAVVEQNIKQFLVGSTTIKELTFEADPRVRFGGCFIETPNGDIDARLESQFEVIEDAIRGVEDEDAE